MNIKNHRLLRETASELYKIIKDYDVCEKVALNYLTIKEKKSEDEARKYHHNCLKDLSMDNINNISWVYYIPFIQNEPDNDIGCEIMCAHVNKKDNLMVYLKILASKQGIRVLGDVVCGAIGIEYFKENLTLRDKIYEINDMKYHLLISCYNNITLD